jgi:hypothetical protein
LWLIASHARGDSLILPPSAPSRCAAGSRHRTLNRSQRQVDRHQSLQRLRRRHPDPARPAHGSLRSFVAACRREDRLWRTDAAFELKASALATGSLLATPSVLDDDLVVLGIAIALFASYGLSHGIRDFEISLLAVAWTCRCYPPHR